jgi:hypothetical protein
LWCSLNDTPRAANRALRRRLLDQTRPLKHYEQVLMTQFLCVLYSMRHSANHIDVAHKGENISAAPILVCHFQFFGIVKPDVNWLGHVK